MKHLKNLLSQPSAGKASAAVVGQPSAHRRYSRLKHLVMLCFLLGSLNVWGETATETITMKGFAGITASGYQNQTKTGNSTEHELTMVAYAFNGSTGQVRGNKTAIAGASITSDDANKNWSLYNSDAMPGAITAIKVTQTATGNNKFQNTLYVSLGTSSQGGVTAITNAQKQDDGGTGTEINFTIDGTQNYTYFKLLSTEKFGAGTLANVEVKVTYTTGGTPQTVVKTLKSIAVEGMTTSYEVGDAFSFDGTCTATYGVKVNDVPQADDEKIVTPTSVSTPDMTVAGDKTITVTYTEDEVEISTTYNINVAAVEGDKLTRETTGVSGNNYTDWSEKTGASGAKYAGNSAGGNDAIQLRSDKNTSGIVSTATGGLIKKVKVAWNSNTASERTLNVYGSNTAYTAASELYGLETQGTLLGTIVKETSTELEITGDYKYVGVRSNSGAMYLTSITFVWGAGKELSSIEVKTNPNKESYNIGDAFDATGLVITATYDDYSTDDIAYAGNKDKFSFSGFNSTAAAAAQAITVTYGGKNTKFDVEIKDVTLQTVTVSGTPATTSYTAGETFDPAGLTVTGHYSDNSEAEITSGITWSYPDANNTLVVDQVSIRVVATVEEIASAAYTVEGLTVTAAPLVASWVAKDQSYENQQAVTSATFGTSNAFTITFDKGTNSNAPKYYDTGTAVRAYGGNTFTLSSTNYKFTQIAITFSSGEDSNELTANVGIYDNGTWTGNSKEVTFTIGGTTGHRRIASITVTYAEALPSVETPTFSVAEGTYFETQNVTITTATAGATIYYTTDGTEPTTGSSVYSDPIAVSTNMTIKAIAVKDGLENSAVASATYAMGPIFASLEELVAADLTSNTMVKVSFSNVAIKKIDTNKKYVTFDIQKEEKDIEIYFSAETLPTTWVVGGTLSGTILAPWKRFVQSSDLVCWELAPESGWKWTDLTYNSPITKEIDHVTVTGTATKTAYVDGEVFDPAGLTVTLYYTDETNEVVTEGILWAPTTALTVGMTSVDVTATVENTTSAVNPVSITVSEIPTKTIAEFIAAGGGRCYLVGVVSNLTNNNKNCTLTDNSGEILLYNISQNGAVTDFVTLDVEEGDRIKVIATTYQVYNQKDEVVAPEFVEELTPEVVAVTGVSVAPTEATVKVGKTITLTATVLPALASNTNVSWKSDETDIATVENGDVTGVAEGTAHITVTTEDGSFTATATITVEAGQSFAGGEWRLVTDAAQLSINDYIIIANAEYNKAMSSTQNSNNRGDADVTIAGGILTYESAPAIFTLKAGNEGGQYAFYDEDVNGYLFAASSSSNLLRTQETVDANASWIITITDGVASVVAQGTNTHNLMQYNNSSKIFSCYNNDQKAIALYKYYSTPLPRYTVTFYANGADGGDAPEPIADQVENATVTLPANAWTKDGYLFDGWKVINNTTSGEITITAGAFTMPASDVTIQAQWALEPEATTYTLVTVASTLKAGDVIVLASASEGKVDGSKSGDFLSAIDGTFDGNTVTVAGANEITLGGSADAWTFTTAEGVLGATAAKKLALDDNEATNTWTISIDASNNATITCGDYGRFLYNANNPRFLNYASTTATSTTMLLPQIYKKASVTPEPVDPVYTEVRNGLVAGRFYTICLDREFSAVRGATLWDIENGNKDEITLIEAVLSGNNAGKPYIFLATATTMEVVYGEETTTTAGSNNGLYGTFSAMTENDLNGKYILSENQLWLVDLSGAVSLPANRAYINKGEIPTENAGNISGRRRVKMAIGNPSQTPTGIDAVDMQAEGVQKVVINGNLYIVREGRMFDTTGRLVK